MVTSLWSVHEATSTAHRHVKSFSSGTHACPATAAEATFVGGGCGSGVCTEAYASTTKPGVLSQ
ncbi:hypothetical protein EON67_01140 [archaeon]|nr:MAG: hypothetical protein EON67_01140 [archaeon]